MCRTRVIPFADSEGLDSTTGRVVALKHPVLSMSSQDWTISPVSELRGHEDRVWTVAWNPARPLLASCSGDKTVRLYHYRSQSSSPDSSETDELPVVKFENQACISTGHSKTVRCVAWAPSGKTFVTGSFDSNIGIWEQEGGDEDDDIYGGDEDGGGGSGSGEWECASLLEGHETECKCVSYSSTGTLLASCSRDKTVWVWEVQPDAEFECMGVLMSHTQDVKCVAWHPTEEILASGSYDDTIRLYVDDPSDDWYDFQTLDGHDSTVWSLAFSPCGEFLASASDDLTIRVWRRAEKWRWEQAAVLKGHDRSIYSISWAKGKSEWKSSEDGDGSKGWLASTGGDGKINVWNITRIDGRIEYEPLATLSDAHGVSDVNCISWCPREGYEDLLATAGDDCSVRVWRVQSGKSQK